MAALTRAAVRQRAAAAVDGISGYTESAHDYDHIGEDPNSYRHKGFAIGVLASVPTGSRQRITEGGYVLTSVGVRCTYKLRPKDRIAAIDEALNEQGSVAVAVMGMSLEDISLEIVELRRPVSIDGEWFFTETIFRAGHILALQ